MRCTVVYGFLLISLLTVFPGLAQRSQIDSLESQLIKTQADTNRVHVLNELADQYAAWGTEPAKNKRYALQCLQLAYRLHYNYGIGLGYKALGRYYYHRSQNSKALQQYQKALPFYQKAGRKSGLAAVYTNIANVTDDMGNSAKAMEYYLESIRIAEEIGDQVIMGSNLQNIGTLLLNQQKYDDALQYLFQALPIYQRLRDERSKAFALNRIGIGYQGLNQPDKALRYFHQSLHLFDSLDLARGKISCYNNLGFMHFILKHDELAFNYYQKALTLGEPLEYTHSMVIALSGIGDVCLRQGKIAQAIAYYQKSLQLAETNQLVVNTLEAYEGLVQACAQQKQYRQAYLYQTKLLALKDSTFTKDNDQKLAQLQAAYAVEKKQAQIDLLQKDRERDLLVRNASLTGLLASLVIIGLVVNRQRLKNFQNRLLREKNEEIAGKNYQLEAQARVVTAQAAALAATNAQLAQQTRQLQELDQVKSNFFTNISHEFRTPLTLILGPLEQMMNQPVEASQVQIHYRRMHRNARQLLELINQLLDLAKLEAGLIKRHQVWGDVHQQLKATTFVFTSLAESNSIGLRFESNYQTIHARYVPDLLDKILNNLLANAFKFTPPQGQVTVTVGVQNTPDAVEPTSQRLEISVADTGRGIPAAQIERIFDRFFQVSDAALGEQPGTGIGLALVKELVAFQQGTISVWSEVGQGSRFTVRIPLAECRFENRDWTDKTTDESEGAFFQNTNVAHQRLLPLPDPIVANDAESRLLIVEDNDEVREFIRDSFRETFRVLEATNGEDALCLAQKEIPNLIITDRMMPGMDGVALCHQLKTDSRTSHIPVILLTAKASEASKIEGLETGADDYILKPFRVQELQVRVKNLITQRKLLRERFVREVKLQPQDIAITSADEVFLRKAINLVEKNMNNLDFIVEVFVREMGMSRMQLHRKLKALTDQSTTEFIRLIRLKRAASLLEQQYGNIAEVMYEVGFHNVSHFASSFKKQFGVNPSDYPVSASREPVNLRATAD